MFSAHTALRHTLTDARYSSTELCATAEEGLEGRSFKEEDIRARHRRAIAESRESPPSGEPGEDEVRAPCRGGGPKSALQKQSPLPPSSEPAPRHREQCWPGLHIAGRTWTKARAGPWESTERTRFPLPLQNLSQCFTKKTDTDTDTLRHYVLLRLGSSATMPISLSLSLSPSRIFKGDSLGLPLPSSIVQLRFNEESECRSRGKISKVGSPWWQIFVFALRQVRARVATLQEQLADRQAMAFFFLGWGGGGLPRRTAAQPLSRPLSEGSPAVLHCRVPEAPATAAAYGQSLCVCLLSFTATLKEKEKEERERKEEGVGRERAIAGVHPPPARRDPQGCLFFRVGSADAKQRSLR